LPSFSINALIFLGTKSIGAPSGSFRLFSLLGRIKHWDEICHRILSNVNPAKA
jgi:hypothetical protein